MIIIHNGFVWHTAIKRVYHFISAQQTILPLFMILFRELDLFEMFQKRTMQNAHIGKAN